MRNKVLTLGLIFAIALSVVGVVGAFTGGTPNVVIENATINIDGGEGMGFGGAASKFTDLRVTSATQLDGVLSAKASANKLGTASTYNPIYVGAGDGCTAILYAASTTLVSSATSTSFCN